MLEGCTQCRGGRGGKKGNDSGTVVVPGFNAFITDRLFYKAPSMGWCNAVPRLKDIKVVTAFPGLSEIPSAAAHSSRDRGNMTRSFAWGCLAWRPGRIPRHYDGHRKRKPRAAGSDNPRRENGAVAARLRCPDLREIWSKPSVFAPD